MADATGVCYTQSGDVKRYESSLGPSFDTNTIGAVITRTNTGYTSYEYKVTADGYCNSTSGTKVVVKYGPSSAEAKKEFWFDCITFYINMIFCYGPNDFFSYGTYPGSTGESNAMGFRVKYHINIFDENDKKLGKDIYLYEEIYPKISSFHTDKNLVMSINIPISTPYLNASYVKLMDASIVAWLGADESTINVSSYCLVSIDNAIDINTWPTTISKDKICRMNSSKISTRNRIQGSELIYQYPNIFITGLGITGSMNIYWKVGSGTSLYADGVTIKYTGYWTKDEKDKVFKETKDFTFEGSSGYTVEYLLSPKDASFGGGSNHSDTGLYDRISSIFIPGSVYSYYIKIVSITMNGHSFYGTIGWTNTNNVTSTTTVTKYSMNDLIPISRSGQMIIIGYGK